MARNGAFALAPHFTRSIHGNCPGGNGVFVSTIVSEGRIIGTWKRTLKKKTVEIALEPFRPLRADEMDMLVEAADQFAAFLGLTAVIKSTASPAP